GRSVGEIDNHVVTLRDVDCEVLQSWIGRGRYHLDRRRQQVAVRGHNGHRYGIAVIVRQVEGPNACRAAVEKAEAILAGLHVEVGLDGAVDAELVGAAGNRVWSGGVHFAVSAEEFVGEVQRDVINSIGTGQPQGLRSLAGELEAGIDGIVDQVHAVDPAI